MLRKMCSRLFNLWSNDEYRGYRVGPIDSALAVDKSGYEEVLKSNLSEERITKDEYRALLDYHSNGFCVLDLSEDLDLIEQLDRDIEAFWNRPPNDLLSASERATRGKLWPMSQLVDSQNNHLREPGFRLIDIQSHSKAAEKLFLHEKVHSLVNHILEQECVAIQSLYFEFGSTQALHRDPWFVVTKPPQNLVACWIALEDIDIDAGPLNYVSGSHVLPFLHDEGDNIILHAPHVTPGFKTSVYDHMRFEMAKREMESKPFTAKKGQVFVWHGSLVHGGSPVLNPELTRKSLVIHFDAKSQASRKGARYEVDGEEFVKYTEKVHERNGCFGYKNPLVQD